MLEICCVTNELIPQKKHILAFQFFFLKRKHRPHACSNTICKKIKTITYVNNGFEATLRSIPPTFDNQENLM